MKIIAMTISATKASEITSYTRDRCVFTNEKDPVLHAVGQLYLDTYEDFDSELAEQMDVCRFCAYGVMVRMEVEVPVDHPMRSRRTARKEGTGPRGSCAL